MRRNQTRGLFAESLLNQKNLESRPISHAICYGPTQCPSPHDPALSIIAPSTPLLPFPAFEMLLPSARPALPRRIKNRHPVRAQHPLMWILHRSGVAQPPFLLVATMISPSEHRTWCWTGFCEEISIQSLRLVLAGSHRRRCRIRAD